MQDFDESSDAIDLDDTGNGTDCARIVLLIYLVT